MIKADIFVLAAGIKKYSLRRIYIFTYKRIDFLKTLSFTSTFLKSCIQYSSIILKLK